MRATSFILSCTAAAWLWAAPVSAQGMPRASSTSESERDLTVVVTQVGCVPREVRDGALATVTLLFHRIGIHVRFTTEPSPTDTETIPLRIWEHAPAHFLPTVLGAARIRNGRQANAFYDRVRDFSVTANAREIGVLLGYAIAHELGHVLQAEPGHTLAGIMKSSWNRTDARLMLIGAVTFTRPEADRILNGLEQRRLAAARPGGN